MGEPTAPPGSLTKRKLDTSSLKPRAATFQRKKKEKTKKIRWG